MIGSRNEGGVSAKYPKDAEGDNRGLDTEGITPDGKAATGCATNMVRFN